MRKTIAAFANRLSASVAPTIEADSYVLLQQYVARTQAVGFELKIGLPQIASKELVSRPLKNAQSEIGSLYIVHIKGEHRKVRANQATICVSA